MAHLVSDVHEPSILDWGFRRVEPPAGFAEPWHTYRIPPSKGSGLYHLYAPSGDWSIAIHDFTLCDDTFLDLTLPEYLSITWYESISAEEYDPFRRLGPNQLTGHYSRARGWRARVHGQVPIRCVGIEITPEFARRYLEAEYGGQFADVRDAFCSLDSVGGSFPELRALLTRLWQDEPTRARSPLLYEGMVLQAMGLLVERTREPGHSGQPGVSPADVQWIQEVMAYVDAHCERSLSLAELSRLACMGVTKFKESFRTVSGMTVTQYLQRRRIDRAEQLLRQQELSISQVARAVGYTCSSRFSELFRRETGLLPSEYRRAAR